MNIWQNLNKDENGFLHIELLILMAILSSVAMIYIYGNFEKSTVEQWL